MQKERSRRLSRKRFAQLCRQHVGAVPRRKGSRVAVTLSSSGTDGIHAEWQYQPGGRIGLENAFSVRQLSAPKHGAARSGSRHTRLRA